MTTREIKQQLEEAESLLLITNALSDLSAMRLAKIRQSVERNIFFFNEIAKVYHLVKKVAFLKKVSIAKNGQTLSIVITSNFKFYGNQNTNLLKFYIDLSEKVATNELPRSRADEVSLRASSSANNVVVIGTTGVEYLRSIHYGKPFQSLIFKKDSPSDEELKSLVNSIAGFSQVLVYYPKFKTVLTQIPSLKDITESSDITEQVINEPKMETNFIFEPDIKKTLQFFDSQLTTLLLEETFLEADLARVAARLVNTSQAEKSAEEFLEEKKKLFANARRTIVNKNLLESISSFSALNKRLGLDNLDG